MGCSISRAWFGRQFSHVEERHDLMKRAAQCNPVPEIVTPTNNDGKDKDTSTLTAVELDREEIDASMEIVNKHGHDDEEAPHVDSMIYYPRSPSFRDYCIDTDDEDPTSRKLNASPDTQDKEAGLNCELIAGEVIKDVGKAGILSNKWGRRRVTERRSLRSFFLASSWRRPQLFTKSSSSLVAKPQ